MFLLKLRNRHFLLLDILIFSLTPYVALMLRLDTLWIPESFVPGLVIYTISALLVRLLMFYWFGLYRRFWRYASIEELSELVMAAGAAMAVIIPLFFVWRALFPITTFARSVLIIDGLLTLLASGGIRFSVRLGERGRRQGYAGEGRRVLVVGAGDAGSRVVRELQGNLQHGLIPVGFIDDAADKQQLRIHGVPVMGTREDLPRLVAMWNIDQVVIALPTASGQVIRQVVHACEQLGVETKTIPSLHELLDGAIRVNQLRDVDIEDLLRREPVRSDVGEVKDLLAGQRVLVTGGGGSIGGELCRQILRLQPAQLIILGHGENSIFQIYHELRLMGIANSKITPLVADTRFADRLRQIMEQYRPKIVFHAAAHKHVPLMEMNPSEAITNNVIGTRNLLEAAMGAAVEHFVMISTDKAVNPTNMMGASKRVAELLVHQAARRSGKPYVTVRFGNVLGSRGSVVLTFKQQIAAGGPVTVTDPQMERYFMTIPEAVQLVLQASVLGSGGELFVLDMGEPIRIMDLAHDLIVLSGLEVGRDIEIRVTGMRAGEKLFEELFIDGEDYERTRHEKILIASNASSFVPDDLSAVIDVLEASARNNDLQAMVQGLKRLVPEFHPSQHDDRRDTGPERGVKSIVPKRIDGKSSGRAATSQAPG